jgi:hypothetical protein
MERSAVVYGINGRLLVAPVVRATTGIGLEVDPARVDQPVNRDALAGALRVALDASEKVVPHPRRDEWPGFFKPFLTAAGVRSFKAFMARAQRVSVYQADGRVTVTPDTNIGAKAGFEPAPQLAEVIEAPDLAAAADAVMRSLARTGA